jgi:hypothetical protein
VTRRAFAPFAAGAVRSLDLLSACVALQFDGHCDTSEFKIQIHHRGTEVTEKITIEKVRSSERSGVLSSDLLNF